VETDKEDVVGQEHKSGEVVGDHALAKDVVSKIANVFDLRMFHNVLVHGDGGDPEKNTGDDHGDDTGYPSENRQRPCLSHNGKTDLVTAEKPGGLLP